MQTHSPATRDPNTPPQDRLGQCAPDNERLVDIYHRWFEVVLVTTPEQLEEAYRLRYQVYVIENPFENPDEHPNGLENDQYDAHSRHALLIHRPSGAIAGTVRLVLPDDINPRKSFPIQEFCRDPLIRDPKRFPVPRMGEISRFSISKQFRRRQTDSMYPDALDEHSGEIPSNSEIRRMIPHLTLGLMDGIIRMSIQSQTTYLCAAMERQLLRLLNRMGIYFDPIGPVVEHHGLRQPCYRNLLDLLNQVNEERLEVWEVMTDEGAHVTALRAIEGRA